MIIPTANTANAPNTIYKIVLSFFESVSFLSVTDFDVAGSFFESPSLVAISF